MEHIFNPLILDLALILIVAALVTLLFRVLKQPLVLGYIIAGFLVGPYMDIIPTVTDIKNVETLAEIGVIFLLFGIGLEFGLKKIMTVGGRVPLIALTSIVSMAITGYFLGKLFGWKDMNCIFFGGMLASSSTTIIIRTFDDLGQKSKNYAKTVLGILVIEDIVVIVIMVMLSAIAVTQSVSGTDMLFTILKLIFFLILWFLLGIFIIPSFLQKIRPLMDDEGYLILSLGLCFGMVIFASKAGFSAQLGAFVMGSIFAETLSAERIANLLKPVKTLFTTIFFVSIGMMIDPQTILQYGWTIVIVMLSVITIKFTATLFGGLLTGQSLKESVQVSTSISQIGEFAFIVATLGMSLGVIDNFLFPIAVGVATIGSFSTPYMIKYNHKIYLLIERIIPKLLIYKINEYSQSTHILSSQSGWRKIVRSYITNISINTTLIFTFFLISSYVAVPFIEKHFVNRSMPQWIAMIGTIIAVSPFVWALMHRKIAGMSRKELIEHPEYNNTQLYIMEAIRLAIGLILLGLLISAFLGIKKMMLIILPTTIVLLILFSKHIQKLHNLIENRFLNNLNSREKIETTNHKEIKAIRKQLRQSPNLPSTWDIHLTDLIVPQNAVCSGRTLSELNWRERFFVNIIYIKRDNTIIYSPNGEVKIAPLDHLGVFGSDDIIECFKKELLTESNYKHPQFNIEDIVVENFFVGPNSPILGVSIKDSAIHPLTDGIVVAIERDEQRILSPSANTVFKKDDIVWIVGEKKKLKKTPI